jgi:hypothetical protein
MTLVPWGCCLVPVPQGVLTSVLAPWCRGLMPVRKAADKWLSLGENRVPTSARRQADDLELDFLRHGSAPFGYFVRGPGVLGTAPKIDWVGLGVEEQAAAYRISRRDGVDARVPFTVLECALGAVGTVIGKARVDFAWVTDPNTGHATFETAVHAWQFMLVRVPGQVPAAARATAAGGRARAHVDLWQRHRELITDRLAHFLGLDEKRALALELLQVRDRHAQLDLDRTSVETQTDGAANYVPLQSRPASVQARLLWPSPLAGPTVTDLLQHGPSLQPRSLPSFSEWSPWERDDVGGGGDAGLATRGTPRRIVSSSSTHGGGGRDDYDDTSSSSSSSSLRNSTDSSSSNNSDSDSESERSEYDTLHFETVWQAFAVPETFAPSISDPGKTGRESNIYVSNPDTLAGASCKD